MSSVAESLDRYTYTDYLKWDDSVRYELIHGEAYMMSAPSLWHQELVGKLFNQLSNFLEGKPCRPFVSPVDVRLFPQSDNSDYEVVQPDVLVVCDKAKLKDACIEGAPDLIIEILSPATKMFDLHIKRDLYLAAGVREYWITGKETLVKLVNVEGNWRQTVIKLTAIGAPVPVDILGGCVLNVPVL